jgi:hypothetical protein
VNDTAAQGMCGFFLTDFQLPLTGGWRKCVYSVSDFQLHVGPCWTSLKVNRVLVPKMETAQKGRTTAMRRRLPWRARAHLLRPRLVHPASAAALESWLTLGYR